MDTMDKLVAFFSDFTNVDKYADKWTRLQFSMFDLANYYVRTNDFEKRGFMVSTIHDIYVELTGEKLEEGL